MSGRNQHSIPQAVLRQFRIAKRGGAPQVHVYHRDRDYPSPVKGTSAQKDFFSSPGSDGETTLDDVMTSYENGPFNTDWTAIIRHPSGQVDGGIAARVIGHLAGRTHHLRGIMRSGASAMGEMVERSFADEGVIARMFDAEQIRPGENFERVAQDFLQDSQLAQLGLPAPALLNILHFIGR